MRVIEIAFSYYAVTDFARARAFYEGVLGLRQTFLFGESGGMQWGEYDIGSGTLAIGCGPEFRPNPDGCAVALEAEDFDDAIATLKQHKVKFRMEPFETPVCRMAMILDPDGNTLCIHKRKRS
jgi:predicted enzyme related to lactoylglutathione lyase